MAGHPSKTSARVVKDYGQPRKFLRDMRARAKKNSRPKPQRTWGRGAGSSSR